MRVRFRVRVRIRIRVRNGGDGYFRVTGRHFKRRPVYSVSLKVLDEHIITVHRWLGLNNR